MDPALPRRLLLLEAPRRSGRSPPLGGLLNYMKSGTEEMTSDIRRPGRSFVKAAEREEAGSTAWRSSVRPGYLITQFLSPLKNQRTDEYGGSFESETRFPGKYCSRCEKRLGPDFPISGAGWRAGVSWRKQRTDTETPKR